jgi:hypothetical protein
VPGQTNDPSVLQVSSSSKLLIDLREDALAVMENLVLENTSDRFFSAGQGGLPIPLPAGSSNGSPIEGGARLEPLESSTMFLRDAVPPADSDGMPLGIESPVVMVPENDHLALAAPGLQTMAPQTDDRGARMLLFQLASVPRNGVLSITVSGMPTRASVGKTIATVLVAALVFAAVLGLRRPRIERRPETKDPGTRREQLFAELVEVERGRRAAGADDAPLALRRAELVAALAAVEGGPEPATRANRRSPEAQKFDD